MKSKLHAKGGSIDDLIECHAKTMVHFAMELIEAS